MRAALGELVPAAQVVRQNTDDPGAGYAATGYLEQLTALVHAVEDDWTLHPYLRMRDQR